MEIGKKTQTEIEEEGKKEGEMSDEGNRWEEIRCPRWEAAEDLKAKGWTSGIRLEGREKEEMVSDGRVKSRERKRGEGDV